MTEKTFLDKLREDNEFIDKVFGTSFFHNKPERQLAYLVGRYYSKATYLQSKELRTNSLIKKLPNYTKRIDLEKIKAMLDECNIVLQKVASMKKSPGVMLSDLRNRIFALLQSIEQSTETPSDLGIAFQMGYDSSLAQLQVDEEESEET